MLKLTQLLMHHETVRSLLRISCLYRLNFFFFLTQVLHFFHSVTAKLSQVSGRTSRAMVIVPTTSSYCTWLNLRGPLFRKHYLRCTVWRYGIKHARQKTYDTLGYQLRSLGYKQTTGNLIGQKVWGCMNTFIWRWWVGINVLAKRVGQCTRCVQHKQCFWCVWLCLVFKLLFLKCWMNN